MGERMRMLAAAAHDLKTLMTRLRLRVALIEDPDQRARADRDVALMATLIEDVLLVARGEERPVVLAPVDVGRLLTDLVSERQALGQAVTLATLEFGQVRADAGGLRRIVENLVENAVAYAGAAEVSFHRDDDRWRLAVVDHGPGLSPGFADQAFEPFARGEASRSRETGGSGLGLSIARSLAHQMGAEIRLETTPGGGLTAVVLFKAD
jgi:signal transduction histidine kinase